MRRSGVLTALVLAALPAAALAHHSVSATYDRDRAVSLSGRVTRIELVNPHSLIHVEMRASTGPAVWTLEGGGPSGLQRLGLNADTLTVGDEVKAIGYPARNGARQAWLTRLETRDRVFDLSFRRSSAPPRPTPAN